MKTISGTIEKGNGQAAALFALPTANIAMPGLEQGLKPGVYASRATVGGKTYNGITFIGQAHLLPGKPWRCETHFFGATGDFVGQHLDVELASFLRAPVAFTSSEQAGDMIRNDVNDARAFFAAQN